MSLEGSQLGQYHLRRLLGSGGMGEVYLAEDARIGQQVAIKVSHTEATFYPDSQSLKDALRLFQREARAIAQLDHPLILPLFGYGEETVNGSPVTYMIMPYRREGTFANWLQQHSGVGILPITDVMYFIAQAADALQYAHDNHVVHQDVKPSNFLMRTNKDHPQLPDLLLADFGIAKLNSATASISRTVRGTPAYMAPEQWSGEPVPATDQYALAVLAYELLAGRPPFSGRQEQVMYQHFNLRPQAPSSINRALSKAIDAVILKALEKRPQDRFASIDAFARALAQAVNSSDGDAPTVLNASRPSQDTDLHIPLAISKVEAQSGTSRTLNTSSGQYITVSVPPGAYDGQTLWLKRPDDQSGSLIITLSVQDNEAPQLASSRESLTHTVPIAPVAERRIVNNPVTPTVSSYSSQQVTEPNIAGGTSNPSTSSPRTIFSKGILIVFVVLALLVIFASFGLFLFLGANRTNNPPDVAATTHASDATSFAATATAQHASTFTQTATANAPFTFPPPSATLVFNDPLANNNNGYGWETKPDTGGVCKFTNGAYQVNENHQEIEYCPAYNTSFGSNFAYQVQITMVQGDEGGLIVRDDTHNISYYFILGHDGNYNLDYYINKLVTHLSTGFASSYHTGFGQSNLIQVIVTSNNLALYVNNQFVQNVSIIAYTPGYIGVFAKEIQNPTEAIFSNAEVWKF